jgi:hypothetical protein
LIRGYEKGNSPHNLAQDASHTETDRLQMWVKGTRTAEEISVARVMVLLCKDLTSHNQCDAKVEVAAKRRPRRREEQLLAEDLHSVLERDVCFRMTYAQAIKID